MVFNLFCVFSNTIYIDFSTNSKLLPYPVCFPSLVAPHLSSVIFRSLRGIPHPHIHHKSSNPSTTALCLWIVWSWSCLTLHTRNTKNRKRQKYFTSHKACSEREMQIQVNDSSGMDFEINLNLCFYLYLQNSSQKTPTMHRTATPSFSFLLKSSHIYHLLPFLNNFQLCCRS